MLDDVKLATIYLCNYRLLEVCNNVTTKSGVNFRKRFLDIVRL